MVRLSRRNGDPLVVNSATVAYIEQTPETLLTLITGERLHVKESVEEVVERVAEWQRRIMSGLIPQKAA